MSLQAPALPAREPLTAGSAGEPAPARAAGAPPDEARQHPAWTDDASWKHRLTNQRVFLQPFVCACLLLPWLRIHPLPHLADLCALMNTNHPAFPT